MRCAAAVVGVLWLVLVPAVAAGEGAAVDTAEAKKHYALGVRHYDLAEYDKALVEFREAYRAADDPAFLFNIAQCYRKLGDRQEAATFYRTYLRRAPNAANRGEIQKRIAELEREIAAAARQQPPPPATATAAPPSGGEPSRDQASLLAAPPPPSAPAAVITAPADEPAAPPSTSVYHKAWFWVAVAAVAGGAATAVILSRSHHDTQQPFCPDCQATAGVKVP
jgi:tetratricopeptide (TPR) repeat protein